MGETLKVTKKLSDAERELIEEMCYTNIDLRILVELNRIRRSMDIPEVVTIAQVTRYRQKRGLAKTKGKHTVVKKRKNNGTS